MTKILTTPRSYGKTDPELFTILEEQGFEVIRNNTGMTYSKDRMIELIADCDGVIVGTDPLDKDVMDAALHLKAIAKYGTGVDNIDLEEAKRRGIKVSVTTGANSDAVADCAFAMMMAIARKLPEIDAKCRANNWKKITTSDVSGATLGIVGLGAIGKLMVERAKGFHMKLIAYDPFWPEEFANANGVQRAELNELFEKADFISLHVPLMPSTRHMIGKEQFSRMKPDAVFVNCARGELTDENALLNVLEAHAIAGAGIDVFEHEPPEDERWYTLDNVILGSHSAASTKGAAYNMGRMATENIIRDLKG